MRDIREHLKDRIQQGFTVGNTTSNKIILFDLDDTIINTIAEIGVVKGGKVIKRLPNAEFNDYVLGPGESFDFGEFDDPILLDQSPFTKYWNTLKREYKKGTHIGILTARSDCRMIKEFFLKNGIRIKDELVIAINDPTLARLANHGCTSMGVGGELITSSSTLYSLYISQKTLFVMADWYRYPIPLNISNALLTDSIGSITSIRLPLSSLKTQVL